MTIEFGRGKDKQKRKARRKKIYGEIREQGRRDAREGTAGENQRRSLNMAARGMAAYAAGRGDVAVNRAKKKYGEMRESLGEKGAAALGKAKDYMSKAKSAAGELTGKARSAVASGYSAVKGKAQDLLKKRKGGSAESYARAIEALEFEVAKQVGILEFASGRNYIEFAAWNPFQKKTEPSKGSYRNKGAGKGGKSLEVVGQSQLNANARKGLYDTVATRAGTTGRVGGGALATTKPSPSALVGKTREKAVSGLGRRGKAIAALGAGLAVGGAMGASYRGYKKGRGRDKQKRRRRSQ